MTDHQRPALLWFRQDLRLADHAALNAAVATGRPVVPIYVLDDAAAGDWAAGDWATGEVGAQAALRGFLDGALAHYAARRDFPGVAGTSRLSPHLHFGEISAGQVWQAARANGGADCGCGDAGALADRVDA